MGGPAIEGGVGRRREWWQYGNLHREDGPAIIWRNSEEWCLNGTSFKTKEEWFNNLPEEQKLRALYSKYFIEG